MIQVMVCLEAVSDLDAMVQKPLQTQHKDFHARVYT